MLTAPSWAHRSVKHCKNEHYHMRGASTHRDDVVQALKVLVAERKDHPARVPVLPPAPHRLLAGRVHLQAAPMTASVPELGAGSQHRASHGGRSVVGGSGLAQNSAVGTHVQGRFLRQQNPLMMVQGSVQILLKCSARPPGLDPTNARDTRSLRYVDTRIRRVLLGGSCVITCSLCAGS